MSETGRRFQDGTQVSIEPLGPRTSGAPGPVQRGGQWRPAPASVIYRTAEPPPAPPWPPDTAPPSAAAYSSRARGLPPLVESGVPAAVQPDARRRAATEAFDKR